MSDAPEILWAEPDGDTIIIHNGASNLEALIATGYLTKYIRADSADAAIAKLGAGDGLVERLNRADEYEPLGHDGWEAAAHIAALTAQLAEKEEQLVSVLQREAATQQRHDAKMEAAKAEAAALRAKLARIASAWPIVRDADCSGGTLASAMDEIEAAISDGGKDG